MIFVIDAKKGIWQNPGSFPVKKINSQPIKNRRELPQVVRASRKNS